MEIEIHCGDPDWEKPKEEEVNSHSQLVQPEPACRSTTDQAVHLYHPFLSYTQLTK